MKTTRIAPGLYEVRIENRVFQIEDIHQASDGDIARAWMLYEMTGDRHDHREWWNDFCTKRSAKAAVARAITEGL